MMAGAQPPVQSILNPHHLPPLKIVSGVFGAVLLSFPWYVALNLHLYGALKMSPRMLGPKLNFLERRD